MSDRNPGRETQFMATVEAAVGWQKWVIAALLVVVGLLGILLFRANDALAQAVRHPQLEVVPGAVAGLYTAGISHANVQAAAFNLASIALDVTPKNVGQKYREFEDFLSPGELLAFEKQASSLESGIKSRDESRVFIADHQHLARVGNDLYKFSETGTYEFFSGDIHLGNPPYKVSMVFSVDDEPSPNNPYGVVIHRFDVEQA